MTNERICYTINAVNDNKHIVWTVAENTPDTIVLTNNYASDVKFVITVGAYGISVKDDHMGEVVDFFFKNDDYTDDEKGLRLAVKSAVRYFNHVY